MGLRDDPVLIHREAIIKTPARDKPAGHTIKTDDTGSYSERIAHLKAKVIAKASANLKPDLLTKLNKEKQVQPANTSSRTQSPNTERKNINTSRSSGRTSSRSSEPIRNTKVEDRLPKNKAVAKESRRKGASHQNAKTNKDQRGTHHVRSEINSDDCDAESPLDASLELWLSTLNLDDLRNCQNVFRRNKVTMETLASLRETHLLQMGLTEKAVHKITQGVKKLNKLQKSSPRTAKRNDGGTSSENSMPYFFYDGQHVDDGKVEESLALKNSSPPSASYTPVVSSAKFSDEPITQHQSSSPPKISNNVKSTNKTDSQDRSVFEEDQKIDTAESFVSSGDSQRGVSAKHSGNLKTVKAVQPKRSKALSADVVNRTLTSGNSAGSMSVCLFWVDFVCLLVCLGGGFQRGFFISNLKEPLPSLCQL